MAAIEAIIFAAAAGFAFVIAITIIVIIGVRQEERYSTLANRNAPSAMAQLARLVLGRHVRPELDEVAAHNSLADDQAPRERRIGSKN
jgi:hypothetical protein